MVRGEEASATGGIFPRREDFAQKRQVHENDRNQKGAEAYKTVLMPEDNREKRAVQNG